MTRNVSLLGFVTIAYFLGQPRTGAIGRQRAKCKTLRVFCCGTKRFTRESEIFSIGSKFPRRRQLRVHAQRYTCFVLYAAALLHGVSVYGYETRTEMADLSRQEKAGGRTVTHGVGHGSV